MADLYEIVETADGEIVLRRAGDESDSPLVSISFSEEAIYFLDEQKFTVAKAMIEAGLEAASDSSEDFSEDQAEKPYLLH